MGEHRALMEDCGQALGVLMADDMDTWAYCEVHAGMNTQLSLLISGGAPESPFEKV